MITDEVISVLGSSPGSQGPFWTLGGPPGKEAH